MNVSVSPSGSIKIEFDIISSDPEGANSTQAVLNDTLPALTINGESYDTQVTSLTAVSEEVEPSHTPNSTTTVTTPRATAAVDITHAETAKVDTTSPPTVTTSTEGPAQTNNDSSSEVHHKDMTTTENPAEASNTRPDSGASKDSAASSIHAYSIWLLTFTGAMVLRFYLL